MTTTQLAISNSPRHKPSLYLSALSTSFLSSPIKPLTLILCTALQPTNTTSKLANFRGFSAASAAAVVAARMGSLGPAVLVSASASAAKMGGGGGGGVQQPAMTERKETAAFVSCCGGGGFQMPLHYPRYKKADYEAMPEWRVDCLLREYGLPAVAGGVEEKRRFAMGAFLWPDQY